MIDQNTMAAAARLASAEANYGRKIAPHPARAPAPIAKTTPAPNVPTTEQLRAEYERDPALQHEFMNFTDFSAYRRAEARGAFRLLRRVA